MKRIRLPLPLAILLLSTIVALVSLLGRGMSRMNSLGKADQSARSVEGQQAAVIYFQVMAWLSRILPAQGVVPKSTNQAPPSGEAGKTSGAGKSGPKAQLCTLNTGGNHPDATGGFGRHPLARMR